MISALLSPLEVARLLIYNQGLLHRASPSRRISAAPTSAGCSFSTSPHACLPSQLGTSNATNGHGLTPTYLGRYYVLTVGPSSLLAYVADELAMSPQSSLRQICPFFTLSAFSLSARLASRLNPCKEKRSIDDNVILTITPVDTLYLGMCFRTL